MAEPGPMGQQCRDIFRGHYTWNHCSDESTEAGRITCIPADFCRIVVLATSVRAWMADGLFYPFDKYRQFIAVYLLYDQRSQDITQSSGRPDTMGCTDRGSGLLPRCIQMEIQY